MFNMEMRDLLKIGDMVFDNNYCGGFGIITNIRIDINNEKVFYIDWYYDSGSIEKINIHEKSEVFKIISISQ